MSSRHKLHGFCQLGSQFPNMLCRDEITSLTTLEASRCTTQEGWSQHMQAGSLYAWWQLQFWQYCATYNLTKWLSLCIRAKWRAMIIWRRWEDFQRLSPLWPCQHSLHPTDRATISVFAPAPYSMIIFGRWWHLFCQTDSLSKCKKWHIISLCDKDFWSSNSYTHFVQHLHSKCSARTRQKAPELRLEQCHKLFFCLKLKKKKVSGLVAATQKMSVVDSAKINRSPQWQANKKNMEEVWPEVWPI